MLQSNANTLLMQGLSHMVVYMCVSVCVCQLSISCQTESVQFLQFFILQIMKRKCWTLCPLPIHPNRKLNLRVDQCVWSCNEVQLTNSVECSYSADLYILFQHTMLTSPSCAASVSVPLHRHIIRTGCSSLCCP